MPTHRQRTVNIDVTARSLGRLGGLSTSDSTQIRAMYPASPIHNGVITVDERRAYFQSDVVNNVTSDGGHTFGTFNMDYIGSPDMGDVDTSALNIPSPYVPNPASPGPGSQNDADKPAPPEGFGQTPSEAYGTGVGSRLSPHASSARIAGQTLGDYVLGRSSAESEG